MKFYYKSKSNGSVCYYNEPKEDENLIQIDYPEFKSLMTKEQRDEYHRVTGIEKQIRELKSLLASTDYQAIKYAEGLLSEEDYALIKAKRQSWREEINELEKTL